MKKLFIISLLTIISFIINAQTLKNSIIIGTVDSVYSKILNQERKVYIYLPNGASRNSIKKYPVVYLFDAEQFFHYITGMIQIQSLGDIIPEMIVVGITNIDRSHDLTPTHMGPKWYLDSHTSEVSGGGENFTNFIEKELIPHIDSLYPTAPYKALIGWSEGGLMVINTLFNHPDLFNSYIAIDPSLWWDDMKLVKQAEKDLVEKKYDSKTLFFAMSNTMNPNMDTLRARKDTSNATAHPRAILEFADALKKNKKNNLRWNWKYYKDDNHNSVPLIATYDALHFIFNFYKLSLPWYDEYNNINLDSIIVSHYKNVSQQMGYKVPPPESMIYGVAYVFQQQKNFEKAFHFYEMNVANYPQDLELINYVADQYLEQKNFDRAFKLFEMNITNHPQSLDVYVGMGDFYDAKGDKQKAIEYYTKALTYGNSPDVKAYLEKLKAEKK